MICLDSFRIPVSDSLGHWKLEATGDELALGGRKLYALTEEGELVKKASKGANLSLDAIRYIAQGGTVEWENSAPSFNITTQARFVNRKIKAT
jgi:hypothetical protein